MRARTHTKNRAVLVVILNFLIVLSIILLFITYMQQYNQKLYD